MMGFPLLVRAIRLSIEAVDAKLEDAAGTLGANRFLVFATVTLPLALPGIIAGMVLCFAKALGEFGATITFVSNIPGRDADHLGRDLHLYADSRAAMPPPARLVVVAIVISLVALVASEWLARRAGTRFHGE